MFKRVGSIALIVMMLISMLCTVTVASAAPAELPELVLTADATTVEHGQVVTVTVSIKNVEKMNGAEFVLPYNKALFSFDPANASNEVLNGFGAIGVNQNDDNYINISWAKESNSAATDLAKLQFKVIDTVVSGQHDLTGATLTTLLWGEYETNGEETKVKEHTYDASEYEGVSNSIAFTVDCTDFYAFANEAGDAAVSGDAATAQHKLTCTLCGAKKDAACSFGEVDHIMPDPCGPEAGTDRITCGVCGYYIDTQVNEILDHAPSTVWTQHATELKHYKVCLNHSKNGCEEKFEEANCSGWVWNNVATQNGSKHTCPTCNRVVACDWAKNPDEFAAGCTKDAYTVYKCKYNCGATYTVIDEGTATGHKYDNACDASCNVCGAPRTIAHKYDNACDTGCNVCGAVRSITHTYTNSCDTYCDICGAARTAGHKFGGYVYNNDATTEADGTKTRTCSVCGEKDTIVATGTKLKPTINFVDVKAGEFYETPVQWAVENGITNGTSATTFSPNAPCTRGQIVTFLWRTAGSPEPQTANNPFADVKSGEYYYKAVLWAVEKGITNGTSATTFSPNATCTRGQVVTFLWRFKGKPAVSGSNPFKDVKAGEYYTDAVIWAVKNSITNGISATEFAPNKDCTRGQIVTFLYRAYK